MNGLADIEDVARQQSEQLAWFAVRVRSHFENIAAKHLQDRGFEQFCPVYEQERQWSDRKKLSQFPLFPGYVFCRLDPDRRLPVLTVPGVVDILGFASQPCPVPEHEIEHIRRMAESGCVVRPWPFITVGQKVLIERGPLKGVEGLLQEIKGKYRLIVSVTMLQRSVATEIDRAWIRPI